MRPEKLTLRNIGPFRGTHTVDFTELGSIFLIYGKTGAGKTTLFDALSYAFYSDAPGGRKGLSRQMRSQFAEDSEESAVELEFVLSGKKYRIARSLPFERLGSRSGKMNNVAEEVTLELFESGMWQNRSSTNKKDTDRKILDLIGLSEAEFSRIVLLPQGEFSQFLKQNSTERKEVLSKLFPVEIYTRVTALARDKAREMSLVLKETENAILALGERYDRLAYDGDRTRLADAADALRAEQTILRRELGSRSAVLEQARAAAEKKRQLRVLSIRLGALESRIPEIEDSRAKLTDSRRAEPLIARFTLLEQLHSRSAELEAELADVGRELHERTDALSGLEAESPAIEEVSREKETLLLRKEQLKTAVDIAGTLEEETAVHAETKKKLALLHKEEAELKADEAGLAGRLSELSPLIGELDARTRESAAVREKLEKIRQIKILSDEYARERLSIGAHSEAVANTATLAAQNARDLEIARAELAEVEAGEKAARIRESAQSLALTLEEGKPCPVCGSPAHPAPAATAVAERFGFVERIEAGKRRCRQLEEKGASLGKTASGLEADLRNAKEKIGTIILKCGIPENEIPVPEAASESIRDTSRLMQEASDALNASQKAFRETEELRRKKAVLETRHALLQEETAAVKAAAAGQKAGIEHKQKRYLEAFPLSDGNNAGAQAFPSSSDAAEALELCHARIMVIEAEIRGHDGKLKEARMRHASLGGKKTELGRSLASLAAQTAEEEAGFGRACLEAGFADGEALRRAFRSPEEMKNLEEDVKTFSEELSLTRTQSTQLEGEIALWKGPDPESAAAEIHALDGRIAETDRRLEDATSSLSALDSLKNRWDELEAERAERSAANGRLSSLASDLTGKNPASTSFDAWILGMYLEEITAYANTRLERMSEGRYRIQLNDSYRKGNSLSGLELEICDAYTGKTRPSGTLSGGETFLASISLALGLADSIQSRAGGIQLDAVFIDEGFGSLDESSLERAITILDEIRGTRMVGLISHVAELRTRIPARIEIVKTGAGSTIKKETWNE